MERVQQKHSAGCPIQSLSGLLSGPRGLGVSAVWHMLIRPHLALHGLVLFFGIYTCRTTQRSVSDFAQGLSLSHTLGGSREL